MKGERQIGKSLVEIAPDHIARYEWAARRLKGRVLDIACGTGYGSYILATRGLHVDAVDCSEAARHHQEKYFKHDRVNFLLGDALTVPLGEYDAAVCFETLEHLEHPEKLVERLQCPVVLVSVPNEDAVPFEKDKFPFHRRHYTMRELDALVPGEKEWFTQYGKWKDFDVVSGTDGNVLCAMVKR